MRIYKVIFTRLPESKDVSYNGRRTIYHVQKHAEAQAQYWRQRGWEARVVQSTEFEWEE